jgi:hypothetical protein
VAERLRRQRRLCHHRDARAVTRTIATRADAVAHSTTLTDACAHSGANSCPDAGTYSCADPSADPSAHTGPNSCADTGTDACADTTTTATTTTAATAAATTAATTTGAVTDLWRDRDLGQPRPLAVDSGR